MGIEDVPKRRRAVQRSKGIPVSTETFGSLMVLFGLDGKLQKLTLDDKILLDHSALAR